METVLVILLVFIVGIAATSMLLKRSATTKDAIAAFQTVLAIFGLLLGGYWYFVERKGEPHVDLSQTAVAQHIATGFVAVEASVAIKNLGTTLVHLRSADIRLQQVEPWPNWATPVSALAGLGFDNWPAQLIVEGKKRAVFHEAELQWPTLRRFASNIDHEVEPGETDTVTATFVVPCSVTTVRVATNIRRTDEDPFDRRQSGLTHSVVAFFRSTTNTAYIVVRPDWWKVRSFVDIAAACKPKKEH